ncbi:MAG: EI24 domain-containing protein [Oligoflexia bacterium]|nr:EI24 domain-containing protein [Oligoflexia bacterium]
MKGLVSGFSIYFQGIRFWLKDGKCLRLSLIPIAINIILFSWGLVEGFRRIPTLLQQALLVPDIWYEFILIYLLSIVSALAFVWVLVFIMTSIATIILIPFFDPLTARVLVAQGIKLPELKGVGATIKYFSKNLVTSLRKVVFMLFFGVLLFFLALIPVVGVLAGVMGMFLITTDLMDFSFDHFGMSFNDRKQLIKRNFFTILGFSLAVGLTAAIPVINMFMLPASVAASAVLVAELLKVSHPIERNPS